MNLNVGWVPKDETLSPPDSPAQAQLQNPILSRVCNAKMLPERLRDRWQSMGFQDHAPSDAPAESAEARRRQRVEMMRQRQQAMMQRMQKKQKEAVESLSLEGESYDDGSCEDAEALQCATCREAASASNPLAMLAAVGDFQGRSSHLGGQPGFRRYTSCRHVIHITCGQQHVVDAHNQAAQRLRRVSLFDVDRGEFGCPMCRSGKPPETVPGSLTLLRAAAAELATSAQLAPQALADEGPPLPLFVMLFRNAALLRHSAAHTQAINQEEILQCGLLHGFAAMTVCPDLQPGATVWCLLRPPYGVPTTVEAIVVQPGALQSILACPLQHQGEGVKINGSNIAFYLVDNRHLHFSTADSQARRRSERAASPRCAPASLRRRMQSSCRLARSRRCPFPLKCGWQEIISFFFGTAT
eukprot:g15084.t1